MCATSVIGSSSSVVVFEYLSMSVLTIRSIYDVTDDGLSVRVLSSYRQTTSRVSSVPYTPDSCLTYLVPFVLLRFVTLLLLCLLGFLASKDFYIHKLSLYWPTNIHCEPKEHTKMFL